MFKRIVKWIIPVLIFTAIILYLCIKYESIDFITNYENITQISSPFEDAIIGKSEVKKIMRSLDRVIISKDAPAQSTREVMHQVHIYSKGGHTEKIISYGDRLLHYYDGECIGEYYVPLVTRLYLSCVYGGVS